MRDLTKGPIAGHLLGLAMFIGLGLIVQTLYFLIDLYFVSRLGKSAIAGVSSAGSLMFITLAASQIVAVGSLSLVSQAIGRKDDTDAQLIFDQGLSISVAMTAGTLVLGYSLGISAVRALAADAASGSQGVAYLKAFLPSLALSFPLAAIGSALRASGVVGVPMAIQALTVVLNAFLAPILIAGWGTGRPLGVVGAGLATTFATLVGVTALVVLFARMQCHLTLQIRSLMPNIAVWRRICAIGLPASGEFFMMFIITGAMYWIIRGFGPQAQAGFGIGSRIIQAMFLPAMAVSFAAAPIAGQNFGVQEHGRVRSTFYHSALIGSVMMLALTFLCRWKAEILVQPFTRDPAVLLVAVEYLRIAAWNFVALSFIFACSGMFQALGDTRPALLSSSARLITFLLPALSLSGRGGVTLHHFWWLSVASITIQAVTSLLLLAHQLRSKLSIDPRRISV